LNTFVNAYSQKILTACMIDKVKHAGKLKLRQKKYTVSAQKQTLQIAKGAKSFYNCNNYVKLLAYTKYYFKK